MSEIIVITYPTALDFWLNGTGREISDEYSFQRRKPADLPYCFPIPNLSEAAKELSLDMNLKTPISFIVPPNKCRVKRKNHENYARPKNLPEKSFVEMNTRMYPSLSQYEVLIASPEYCFLCAAKDYSFCELVEIGMNLCARYVKDLDSSFGQCQREPLVLSTQLLNYISKAKGMNNYQKALRAASFVQDYSRSPIESKLATMICIPKNYGGYGMKPPLLNYDIYHSKSGKYLLNREKSNCDMVWTKEKIILEYDSDMAHANADQFAYDKMKYRSLTMSDYMVIPIVRRDLQSLDRMDEIFMRINKQLTGKTRKADYQKCRLKREETYRKSSETIKIQLNCNIKKAITSDSLF